MGTSPVTAIFSSVVAGGVWLDGAGDAVCAGRTAESAKQYSKGEETVLRYLMADSVWYTLLIVKPLHAARGETAVSYKKKVCKYYHVMLT